MLELGNTTVVVREKQLVAGANNFPGGAIQVKNTFTLGPALFGSPVYDTERFQMPTLLVNKLTLIAEALGRVGHLCQQALRILRVRCRHCAAGQQAENQHFSGNPLHWFHTLTGYQNWSIEQTTKYFERPQRQTVQHAGEHMPENAPGLPD